MLPEKYFIKYLSPFLRRLRHLSLGLWLYVLGWKRWKFFTLGGVRRSLGSLGILLSSFSGRRWILFEQSKLFAVWSPLQFQHFGSLDSLLEKFFITSWCSVHLTHPLIWLILFFFDFICRSFLTSTIFTGVKLFAIFCIILLAIVFISCFFFPVPLLFSLRPLLVSPAILVCNFFLSIS